MTQQPEPSRQAGAAPQPVSGYPAGAPHAVSPDPWAVPLPQSSWARPDDTPPIEPPPVPALWSPRHVPAPTTAAVTPMRPVPPPPSDGRWRAARVEPLPGTPYATVHPEVAPATSGPAVGSLVAGIAGIAVSFLVACFGLAGAQDGWGIWVAGAFSLLGGLAGLAAVGLVLAGRRQILGSGKPGRIRFTGRGVAIAGISCGGVALGIVLLSLVLVSFVQLG